MKAKPDCKELEENLARDEVVNFSLLTCWWPSALWCWNGPTRHSSYSCSLQCFATVYHDSKSCLPQLINLAS